MNWSWNLGKIAGIRLRLHFTFLLLLGFIGFMGYSGGAGWNGAFSNMFFLLVLFGVVVLHELGHALAAKRYGVETLDITLLPIGGQARMARIPEEPKQELVIALAGPAVNVVLAFGAAIFFLFGSGLNHLGMDSLLTGAFLQRFFWMNVLLAGFNLLPAFPMDGGRILRALLAYKINHLRATEIAVTTGRVMALGFVILGFIGNTFLILIAGFIWLAGKAELNYLRMRKTYGQEPGFGEYAAFVDGTLHPAERENSPNGNPQSENTPENSQYIFVRGPGGAWILQRRT